MAKEATITIPQMDALRAYLLLTKLRMPDPADQQLIGTLCEKFGAAFNEANLSADPKEGG